MAYISFQPSDFFSTKLFTGNASAGHAITGVGFQPDMVWLKDRIGTNNHSLYDSVRGVTKAIRTSTDGVETTTSGVTTFGADGFTVGDNAMGNAANAMVSWNWKANGAGSANTDGNINTTVSVNTTAGFSIVKYTGNASATATLGHGLNAVPKMILLKKLNNATSDWVVYHEAITYANRLKLNTTDASASSPNWRATPTSDVFNANSSSIINESGDDYIAYCFADVTGYSKFGSYTGNGDGDGPFVYTGFRPAWVMIKSTTSAEGWFIYDNKRLGYNPDNNYIYADDAAAEGTADNIDILSNGFKVIRNSSAFNASGVVFTYAAFAEFPIVSSNNIPGVSR
jgi:hypothetical protein|tara:strand:- start:1511 stop:2533 length:1023 start_codon:yes stop_codon:yes gene_type:complete